MSAAAPEPDVPFEAAEPAHPGAHHAPAPRTPGATPAQGPAYPDSEDALLSACLIDEGATLATTIDAGVRPDTFTAAPARAIFAGLQDLRDRQLPITLEVLFRELKSSGAIQAAGGMDNLLRVTHTAPTTAEAKYHLTRVQDAAALRGILAAIERTRDEIASRNGTGAPASDIISDLQRRLEFATTRRSDIRDRYLARQFSQTNPPPDTQARISVVGRPACSPGNITNLIAQSKAGKSSFLSGVIASAIVADQKLEGRDTLGVTATPPGAAKFIHIDTEQSPFDHDQLIRLCVRRAQVDVAPSWLWSFGLAGFNAQELRSALTDILRSASRSGGVYAIALDGAADFVNDVNDPGECNPFVAELHGIAISHNCPLITVVHENPGQDFGKMRGHLGFQLERKAESNLRLRKTDEITVVFSEKMRRAPILEKEGPRFKWSQADGMHMSCASLGRTKDTAKADKLRDFAQAIFDHLQKPSARYGEFLKAMQEVRKISPSYAEDKFNEMKKLEVISKDIMGAWRIPEYTAPPA